MTAASCILNLRVESSVACAGKARLFVMHMQPCPFVGKWGCFHVNDAAYADQSKLLRPDMRVREVPKGALQWAAVPACGQCGRAETKHRQDLLPKVQRHLLPPVQVSGVRSPASLPPPAKPMDIARTATAMTSIYCSQTGIPIK